MKNKRFKNFKSFINESNSLDDYSKDDLYKMIKDTFSVSGVLKNHKDDVQDELISFIDNFSENEHKQLWIGYKLNLKKLKNIPDDFDNKIYDITISKLSNKLQEIINKYLKIYKKTL